MSESDEIFESNESVDQLLCEHRWVRPAEGDEHLRCVSCDLDYAEYVQGEVRAALTRQGTWP